MTKLDRPLAAPADLAMAAVNKPVRRFLQIDCFTGHLGDDFIHPDDDGDCLFYGVTDELNRTNEVRVLIPVGVDAATAKRALLKCLAAVDGAFAYMNEPDREIPF